MHAATDMRDAVQTNSTASSVVKKEFGTQQLLTQKRKTATDADHGTSAKKQRCVSSKASNVQQESSMSTPQQTAAAVHGSGDKQTVVKIEKP